MQSFIGKVIGNKTAQTVAVEFFFFKKHPKYQKVLKKTTRLLVHNELDGVQEGDTVRIVKSRPYSKNKHFLLTEVVSRSLEPQKVEETKEEAKVVVEKKEKSKATKKSVKAKK